MVAEFRPGFRLSRMDVVMLICGGMATDVVPRLLFGHRAPESYHALLGTMLAIVVINFFLFCNVFRIARTSELIWACFFTAAAYGTIAHGVPSPLATFAAASLATGIAIGLEMRKPSYHGVFWQRINPGLPAWWHAHRDAEPAQTTASQTEK